LAFFKIYFARRLNVEEIKRWWKKKSRSVFLYFYNIECKRFLWIKSIKTLGSWLRTFQQIFATLILDWNYWIMYQLVILCFER
jgi:hypothetical protein